MLNPTVDPETHKRQLFRFVQLLRRMGLAIGSNQVLTWMKALQVVNQGDPESFYFASESALLNRAADRALFQQAFRLFWQERLPGNLPGNLKEQAGDDQFDASRQQQTEQTASPAGTEPAQAGQSAKPGLLKYSPREMLRTKDFAAMTEQEQRELEQFLAGFRFEPAGYRTRRFEPGAGSRLDFRRSIRRNMRLGGEWLHWDRRRRKIQQPKIVVLADISGSMERYSRVLLRFIYGLARGYQPGVEAFLFGTRLTRITPALKSFSAAHFTERIGALAPDWSGGTQIGGSLEAFHLEWARRVLNQHAVVMVISDGWDRGDPERLARAMARLQRSASGLIWLNPLLGSETYQPETRGMKAALPYIDHFLPAHNLDSLISLGHLLARLSHSMESPNRNRTPPHWRVAA